MYYLVKFVTEFSSIFKINGDTGINGLVPARFSVPSTIAVFIRLVTAIFPTYFDSLFNVMYDDKLIKELLHDTTPKKNKVSYLAANYPAYKFLKNVIQSLDFLKCFFEHQDEFYVAVFMVVDFAGG